jgi:hypothetical protein
MHGETVKFTYVRFISLGHESFRYTTVGLSDEIRANETYLLLSVSAMF